MPITPQMLQDFDSFDIVLGGDVSIWSHYTVLTILAV